MDCGCIFATLCDLVIRRRKQQQPDRKQQEAKHNRELDAQRSRQLLERLDEVEAHGSADDHLSAKYENARLIERILDFRFEIGHVRLSLSRVELLVEDHRLADLPRGAI